MPTTTREWIHKTVDKLKDREAEQLKDYLEFLAWKSKQQKSEPQKTRKNPIAQKIVEAMKEPPHLIEDDIQALLQVIDEGKQPIRFESPFDGIDGLSQQ